MVIKYKCLLFVTLFKQTQELNYVSLIDTTLWSNGVMFSFDLRDKQQREHECKRPFLET